MFVDASAIVAILSLEPEHEELAERLNDADAAITSSFAIFEAVAAIVRKEGLSVADARAVVQKFLDRVDAETVPVTAETGFAALDAFARYGKGRGHPAQLNLCDCFAYAMAKQYGMPLLYKGDDFSLTDLA
ncbi:MAG: type II toxin-antitoxin system VapC family toxin [Propylenella sp.]